jgi:FkbM family methyltransferase
MLRWFQSVRSDRADNIVRWRTIGKLQSVYGVTIDFEGMLACTYRKLFPAGAWIADVGAHIGMHSDAFIKIVGDKGRLAVIEARPDLIAGIKAHIGERPNVDYVAAAVSDKVGTSTFWHARARPGESGLLYQAHLHDADPVEISVDVTTLDLALSAWNRLDYIKMDIEGGELNCLKGGEQVISRYRPIISFECSSHTFPAYGYSGKDFIMWAERHDYTICDLFGFDVTNAFLEITARNYTWDFYYVPHEKMKFFCHTLQHTA